MSLECDANGGHCCHPQCGVFDFLPATCPVCRRHFCLQHLASSAHDCDISSCLTGSRSLPSLADPSLQTSATSRQFLKCGHCAERSLFVMACDVCSGAYCAAHRFEHMHAEEHAKQKVVTNADVVSAVLPWFTVRASSSVGLCTVERIVFFVSTCSGTDQPASSCCVFDLPGACSLGRLCDDAAQHYFQQSGAGAASIDAWLLLRTSATSPSLTSPAVFLGECENDASPVLHVAAQEKHRTVKQLCAECDSGRVAALVFALGCDTTGSTAVSVRRAVNDVLRCDLVACRRLWLACRAPSVASIKESNAPSAESAANLGGAPEPSTASVVMTSRPIWNDAESPVCAGVSLLDRPFGSTKAAPVAAALCKGKSPRHIAVFAANDRAPPFVMAYDPAWSLGKWNDVLQESMLKKWGSSAADSKQRVVLELPSQRWISYERSPLMSELCSGVLPDKGAVLVADVPLEVPDGSSIASVQKLVDVCDAKRVKRLQLMECSLM